MSWNYSEKASTQDSLIKNLSCIAKNGSTKCVPKQNIKKTKTTSVCTINGKLNNVPIVTHLEKHSENFCNINNNFNNIFNYLFILLLLLLLFLLFKKKY